MHKELSSTPLDTDGLQRYTLNAGLSLLTAREDRALCPFVGVDLNL